MDLTSIYLFIEYGILGFVILGFALLIGIAVIVRDVDMIKKRPFVFVTELLLVSLLPAVPVLFFAISRGMPFGSAVAWMYGLAIKFGLFHVLAQISGLYTFMFSY